MAAGCDVCHKRGRGHECIFCGSFFESVELCREHQDRRMHFGGHSTRKGPLRRVLQRRTVQEEHEHSSDEELELPILDEKEEGEEGGSGGIDEVGANGKRPREEMSSSPAEGRLRLTEATPTSTTSPIAPAVSPSSSEAGSPLPVATLERTEPVRNVVGANSVSPAAESIPIPDDDADGIEFFRDERGVVVSYSCNRACCKGKLYTCSQGKKSNGFAHAKDNACPDRRREANSRRTVDLRTVFGAHGDGSIPSQEKFEELLVNLFVETGTSWNVIESKSFVVLLDYMRTPKKDFHPFSRRTLARRIDEKYAAIRLEKAKFVFDENVQLALSADCWTSKTMRGYLALNCQFFERDPASGSVVLRSSLLDLRAILKGSEGHTGKRLCDEMEWSFKSLALNYLRAGAKGDRVQLEKLASPDAMDDPAVLNLASSALQRTLCIVTDGGPNMVLAAKNLMMRHGGDLARARLCVSHSLQLLLKYFCVEDKLLADSLAACNFIASATRSTEFAREALGHIDQTVSTRWSSQITGAESILKNREKIEKFAAGGKCTPAFQARVALLRNINGWEILRDFVDFTYR